MLGIVWVGRGTEWFVWPADSFMAGQLMWTWRGLALIAMGGVAAFAGLRLGRR